MVAASDRFLRSMNDKRNDIILEVRRHGLSLGLFLLLALGGALRLDVLIVHSESLVNLGLESSLVLSTVECQYLALFCSNM